MQYRYNIKIVNTLKTEFILKKYIKIQFVLHSKHVTSPLQRPKTKEKAKMSICYAIHHEDGDWMSLDLGTSWR
jgi:hypothetical protein